MNRTHTVHVRSHIGADRTPWIGLVAWLVITFAAAFVGGRFEPGAWYAALDKPAWNPPSWVFAPVWTLLYLAMAFAAWLVWRRHGFRGARLALGLYVAQLVLNTAWSWLFFGRHDIALALVDIVLLLGVLAVTTVQFWWKQRAAGVLMIPYLAWVSFATALNIALLVLN